MIQVARTEAGMYMQADVPVNVSFQDGNMFVYLAADEESENPLGGVPIWTIAKGARDVMFTDAGEEVVIPVTGVAGFKVLPLGRARTDPESKRQPTNLAAVYKALTA